MAEQSFHQPEPTQNSAPSTTSTIPDSINNTGTSSSSSINNNNNNNNNTSTSASNKTSKPNYYDVLEIPKDAPQSAVTKAHYRLAKRYHPDKNLNDPTAEERFKVISEAYQVLSDPQKRAQYDRFGSTEAEADPRELFRNLFGAGKFDDYFKTPLAEFFDMNQESMDENATKRKYEENRDNAVRELSGKLLEKLTKLINSNMSIDIQQQIIQEAIEMSEAPGGSELLYLLGYVYYQESKQYSASFLGIPAFFSELSEKGHIIKEAFSAMNSAMKMQREGQSEEAQIQQGLKALWKSGKLQIEMSLRLVCDTVLGDANITQQERNKRTKALKFIGDTYKRIGSAAMKANGTQGPPQFQ